MKLHYPPAFALISLLTLILVSCEKNHAPVINQIVSNPETRSAGTLFTLTVQASDEDFDALTYRWSADGGVFADSTNLMQTEWLSPVDGNGRTYTITVAVSDGIAETSGDYQITLTEPQFGGVSGHTLFAGCKISIPGVTVTMYEKSAISDTDGYFSLSGIPVGNWTLTAAKEDFTPSSRSVQLVPNGSVNVTIQMTSVVHSTKVFGIVRDQDGEPITGATVVMLNPDKTESQVAYTTNSTGYYRLWSIPHGERTIVVKRNPTDEFGFEQKTIARVYSEIEYQLDVDVNKFNLKGQFTDRRDQHVYGYKIYGKQTWMTENLAWLPSVSPSSKGSIDELFYYVYDYNGTDVGVAKATDNYINHGVLYNYYAALNGCPAGWHLPEDKEWNTLIAFIGANPGTAMKSVSGWSNHGNGTNSSGFNAYPAGSRGTAGTFAGQNDLAGFWTTAWTHGWYLFKAMLWDETEVFTFGAKETSGYSVRCIKDQ